MRSSDGITWTTTSVFFATGVTVGVVIWVPEWSIFLFYNEGINPSLLYYSTDGGVSWTQTALQNSFTGGIRALLYSPYRRQYVVTSNLTNSLTWTNVGPSTPVGVLSNSDQTIAGSKTFTSAFNSCAAGFLTAFSNGDNASVAQSIPNNTATVLKFSNVKFSGITYDVSTGKFTVPTRGVYLVSASISYGASLLVSLYVQKNGASRYGGGQYTSPSGGTGDLSTAATIVCAANDMITFVVSQQSGLSQNVTPGVYGITLICRDV